MMHLRFLSPTPAGGNLHFALVQRLSVAVTVTVHEEIQMVGALRYESRRLRLCWLVASTNVFGRFYA